MVNVPAISEPVIIWTTKGEVEVEERENNGLDQESHSPLERLKIDDWTA